MFAISIGADNQILDCCSAEVAPDDWIIVDVIPFGIITDYDYIGGKYVLNQARKDERIAAREAVENAPTRLDKVEADLYYVAMMEEIEL